MSHEVEWSGKRFALVAVATTIAVVACGWFTGIRIALHTGLLSLLVVAFLPFVIVAALIGIALLVSLASSLVDGPPPGLDVELMQFPKWTRAYYRFLYRIRRSPWLGVPAGASLGCLVVWGLLMLVVVPHELETSRRLIALQNEIEATYERDGTYPSPSTDGYYQRPGTSAPVLDGFDRPFSYDVTGRWKAKSYRLLSYGADGQPSSDDMCIEGKTGLQKAIEVASSLINLVRFAEDVAKDAPLRDGVEVVRALRCERGALDSE